MEVWFLQPGKGASAPSTFERNLAVSKIGLLADQFVHPCAVRPVGRQTSRPFTTSMLFINSFAQMRLCTAGISLLVCSGAPEIHPHCPRANTASFSVSKRVRDRRPRQLHLRPEIGRRVRCIRDLIDRRLLSTSADSGCPC